MLLCSLLLTSQQLGTLFIHSYNNHCQIPKPSVLIEKSRALSYVLVVYKLHLVLFGRRVSQPHMKSEEKCWC